MKDGTLIIFTASYPFTVAAEYTFIEPELPHLMAQFRRVVLVPSVCSGKPREMPIGVEVDASLAFALQGYVLASAKLRGLASFGTSKMLVMKLASRPSVFLDPRKLRRLLQWVLMAQQTRAWVETFIRREALDLDDTLFYTYWLESYTVGIGLVKQKYPKLKLVSRALGYDIYEERHSPPYLPFRKTLAAVLDRLYVVSAAGRDYFCSRRPELIPKSKVLRLYVNGAGLGAGRSGDGVFRVFSCSSVTPIKRVDLIYAGLRQMAVDHPGRRICWTHCGDGPLMPELRTVVADSPANLECVLAGQQDNQAVLEHYRREPVDVFINASISEGTPVSIMEAMSAGIPVVATAVGGNPEVVDDKDGKLLSANPSPEEIAEALGKLLVDPAVLAAKGKAAYQRWQDGFDAAAKYPLFARELRAISRGEMPP